MCLSGFVLLAQWTSAQDMVSASVSKLYAGVHVAKEPAAKQTQSLKTLLSEIEQRYKIRFVYESSLIDRKQLKAGTLADNLALEQVLEEVLVPLKLGYLKLDDRTYGIIKQRKPVKAAAPNENSSSALPAVTEVPALKTPDPTSLAGYKGTFVFKVSGKVTDDQGMGIPGVNVILKGTSAGTSTNIDGQYTLDLPDAASSGVLIFSYIGYTTEEIAINNRSTVDVTLMPDIKSLSEVVVVGYGVQRKSDITGSVAIVDAAEIKKVATSDVAQLLQGRASGVAVTSDGQPGAVPNVRIRGLSTFGDAQPLYVIDGVPVGTTPRDFNPNDVESVQVLKDASAGAIYGSRAANGVIIITTKQGKKNTPLRVEYNGYYGVDEVWQRMPVTDRATYQLLNNEARRNAGQPIAPGNDPNSPSYISNVDTDWQKEGLKTGTRQNHNLNFSGGGTNTTYNVSLDYFGNEGTYVGNGPSYNRYSGRVNSTAEKGIFKIGQSLYYAHSNENPLLYRGDVLLGNQPPLINNLVTAIPTMMVRDPNNVGGFGGTLSDVHDVISLNGIGVNSLFRNYVDVDRIFANVYGELQLFKKNGHNLKYKLNLSYDRTLTRDYSFQPAFQLGYFFRQDIARLDDNSRTLSTGLVENTLNYEKTFGKHALAVLVGQMYQTGSFIQRFGHAEGFTEPYYPVLDNGPDNKSSGGFETQNVLSSYLGRLNYSFDDRYLLTATMRRDGSSRFAPSNRFGYFPSVALGWKLSNEGFFGVSKDVVTELKLRGSYGQLGNQNIGDYLYNAFINPNIVYNFNGQRVTGGLQTNLVSEKIRWETRTIGNLGLDAVLFDGRFDLSVEYYDSKTTDILVRVPGPASTGSLEPNILINAGSLKNSGFEFSAAYHKSQGDFTFTISANATTVNNKVLALGGNNEPIYGAGSITEVGSEIGQHYGWVTDGIFQTRDEVDAANAIDGNPATPYQYPGTGPGDLKFKDLNGDGVVNLEDRTYLGSAIPKLNYGLNFTAGYKNFDLTIFASGSSGFLINSRLYRELMHTGGSINYHEDILNRWTPNNTGTSIPRLDVLDQNQNGRDSDRSGWLQDGTYLRINTVSLGYTLPANLIKGLNRARVYVTAQNLYTFQGYKGYNPDFTNSTVFGGADTFSPGFDVGSYPRPRTIMAGVQIGF